MSEFWVAPVFSDHMVLQRDKNITVFGTWKDNHLESGKNEKQESVILKDGIVISISHQDDKNAMQTVSEATAICSHDGTWKATLPGLSAGEDYVMQLRSSDQSMKFTDIAVGEVWLAGGQSNMEYELKDCKHGEELLSETEDPKVRFYYTPKCAMKDQEFYEKQAMAGWDRFSKDKAQAWSAVGYQFAKRLAKQLGVVVGIIGCNCGGTSASVWMSRERIMKKTATQSYITDYDSAVQGKSEEQQIKEYRTYQTYHEQWQERCNECYRKNPKISWDEVQKICGKCQWPGPMCCANPYRPAGLYETMLQTVLPYTLRGFIYYQGESDDHKPDSYEELFLSLIDEWREDWDDITLPFIFVQLPMHQYIQDPDFKNWCKIREAQMRVYESVKNTGIAVCLDCGEFNEIHPKDKSVVAKRLADQALYQVYQIGHEDDVFGPVYENSLCRGNEIEITFAHAKDGIVVKEPVHIQDAPKTTGDYGFEIAGEDLQFVPAKAKINVDSITVSADQVSEPRFVRYCWTNYGEVWLYGKNGIPVAPFRTDPIRTVRKY